MLYNIKRVKNTRTKRSLVQFSMIQGRFSSARVKLCSILCIIHTLYIYFFYSSRKTLQCHYYECAADIPKRCQLHIIGPGEPF